MQKQQTTAIQPAGNGGHDATSKQSSLSAAPAGKKRMNKEDRLREKVAAEAQARKQLQLRSAALSFALELCVASAAPSEKHGIVLAAGKLRQSCSNGGFRCS